MVIYLENTVAEFCCFIDKMIEVLNGGIKI